MEFAAIWHRVTWQRELTVLYKTRSTHRTNCITISGIPAWGKFKKPGRKSAWNGCPDC